MVQVSGGEGCILLYPTNKDDVSFIRRPHYAFRSLTETGSHFILIHVYKEQGIDKNVLNTLTFLFIYSCFFTHVYSGSCTPRILTNLTPILYHPVYFLSSSQLSHVCIYLFCEPPRLYGAICVHGFEPIIWSLESSTIDTLLKRVFLHLQTYINSQ